ncbi:ABC-type nitrate sulfonate bicarbonate transport system, ATPase component [Lactobacillus selangorensis]|uniref:ABC-type nitrate sulfonate bicarbonate transport system, ATPase component n=1 Tax=Lactobacillus selangorensis TaxID=81857 RepID=A0A0R2FJ12_9LACO|nr:ABC transporter ATP-binding protein [Lactobacillus selangorensis]KRN28649.1 ABC-type nitrate sulfonate bicarbonate transport system, ATPase component [Lactobacillus selangorensis]KRN32941.1 ABC-type nitrate sulfonate bicarbonate transport system, ATPase component [Lactobacillus selangorensis]
MTTTTAAQPLLTINDLGKQYGPKVVLRDVNLTIQQGEFVALVGMSGGGKSTLLRLIAGLEKMSTGTLTYPDVAPVIRVMFQDDRLLPWMTVRQNITFKRNDAALQARSQKMLARVGLEKWADQYPAQLSGGQKQRVALARALMAKPQLLLLDEPLGALDALTRRKMQDLILQVCQEEQLTTILVTHDVEEAARMADRTIVIKDGTNRYAEKGPDKDDPAAVGVVADQILHDIIDPEGGPA